MFGFGFRGLDYRDAFVMMGSIVMASSLTSFFIKIPCHAGLISGEDNHAVINARERHLERLRYEAAAQSEGEATEQHHDDTVAVTDHVESDVIASIEEEEDEEDEGGGEEVAVVNEPLDDEAPEISC